MCPKTAEEYNWIILIHLEKGYITRGVTNCFEISYTFNKILPEIRNLMLLSYSDSILVLVP